MRKAKVYPYEEWRRFVSIKQLIRHDGAGIIFASGMTYCFYNSLLLVGIVAVIACLLSYFTRERLFKYVLQEAEGMYKEGLYILTSSLLVGQSLENGIRHMAFELSGLYGKQGVLYYELSKLMEGIDNGERIENQLQLMATRLKIEGIQQLAEIIMSAKRSGGNMVEIVNFSAQLIREKIDLNQEIHMLVHKKKTEWLFMSLFVPVMILYLRGSMEEFTKVFYGTLQGRMAMTMLLGLYASGMIIGKKIIDHAIEGEV
mgnify:CR=1 FL=1